MIRKETLEMCKYQAVESFVGQELLGFVERRIGIDFRKALEGEITPYVQSLIDKSIYFESQKAGRTDLQLIKELIYSRCIEFRLLDKWKERNVVLNGSDKDCLITLLSSNNPDMWEMGTDNYYEVVGCHNGFCINQERYVMGKAKMMKLCENAKKHNQYLVVVDVLYHKYCFLPLRENVNEMDYVELSPFGSGYNINLKGVDWFLLEEKEDFIIGSVC